MIRYPIGIQNFEKLRRENLLYIDKTEYIENLLRQGSYFFLSRPRRFGKSLFLSTLKAYFEGKRELFKGLYLDMVEDISWDPHPVILIDFNGENYKVENALVPKISSQLEDYENRYGIIPEREDTLSVRFSRIIRVAKEKTGKNVVVLIDEYDKPILDTVHLPELHEENRNILAGFYAVIKSSDEHIRFCMLTGITKFSHVNIFSGLNNLNDISFSNTFEGICGITGQELHDNFGEGLKAFSENQLMSAEEILTELKKFYDGYHFSRNMTDVYNPFSLLKSFYDANFGYYWFQTGTPTFLLNIIREEDVELVDLEGMEIPAAEFEEGSASLKDVPVLMYQTGYLTIKSYDRATGCYTLGYPNLEVKSGFFRSLLPVYTGRTETQSSADVRKFVRDLNAGDVEVYLERMNALFADFPYENALDVEIHFQNIMYVVAKLMGLNARVEYHTSTGRIDMVIQTKKYVYIFEFKRDKSPAEALRQIEEKGYALPFASDPREIVKIGVEFSTEKRCISGWEIADNRQPTTDNQQLTTDNQQL